MIMKLFSLTSMDFRRILRKVFSEMRAMLACVMEGNQEIITGFSQAIRSLLPGHTSWGNTSPREMISFVVVA